jgi:hypothetical protein
METDPISKHGVLELEFGIPDGRQSPIIHLQKFKIYNFLPIAEFLQLLSNVNLYKEYSLVAFYARMRS